MTRSLPVFDLPPTPYLLPSLTLPQFRSFVEKKEGGRDGKRRGRSSPVRDPDCVGIADSSSILVGNIDDGKRVDPRSRARAKGKDLRDLGNADPERATLPYNDFLLYSGNRVQFGEFNKREGKSDGA